MNPTVIALNDALGRLEMADVAPQKVRTHRVPDHLP